MKPPQPENSAVPPVLSEEEENMRELDGVPAAAAPGSPPAPPPTVELLYKGAADLRALWRAQRAYPALYKLAEEKVIGEVKCQPSSLKVSAVGEGDHSRLKVKPWTIFGQEAFDSLDECRRSK